MNHENSGKHSGDAPFGKRRRCVLIVMGSSALVAFAVILYAAHRIEKSSISDLQGNLSNLPHKRVALVLGCSPVLSSGAPNWYFENRIAAAAAVFRAQKVDYLLVSGDNHVSTYDEPTAMKHALLRLGVPEDNRAEATPRVTWPWIHFGIWGHLSHLSR